MPMQSQRVSMAWKVVTHLVVVVMALPIQALVLPVPVIAAQPTGTITVCKIIVDVNNQIITNPAQIPAGDFALYVYGVGGATNLVATSTFSATSFAPNEAIFSDTPDAECETFSDINFGQYNYAAELITGASNGVWGAPKYNDEYTNPVADINDFGIYAFNQNEVDGQDVSDWNGVVQVNNGGGNDHPYLNRRIIIKNQFLTPAPTLTGTLEICKVIVDHTGAIITDTSSLATSSFSLTATLNASTTSYQAILNTGEFEPNAALVSGDDNNIACVTFENVPAGTYAYGQEIILSTPDSSWATPHYNDGFSGSVSSIDDFAAYQLSGPVDSDGVLNVYPSPDVRRLVIKNQLTSYCGDGIENNTEACDAGQNNGQACSPAYGGQCTYCSVSCDEVTVAGGYCGDSITNDGNEQCDDGNQDNNDACLNTCVANVCGDGVLNPNTEACDDGNTANGDSCNEFCALASCGNGTVDANEQCDDSNNANNDGCSAACIVEFCGDEITNNGEMCDDGNDADNDGCSAVCQLEVCGDAILQTGEACDDGNAVDGDGCSAQCVVEFCGDAITNNGETCDDGNQVDDDYCSNACQLNNPSCGNGVYEPNLNEQCDDGNFSANDGCTALCQFETSISCETAPSKTGWFTRYFNYPSNHINVEGGASSGNNVGDPLSAVTPWTADWYSDTYFKFSRIEPAFTTGSGFFVFDPIAKEESNHNGHDYYFGLHTRGYFTATATGTYQFALGSDDDSWLYIDGDLLIDNHGIHSFSTKKANITLEQGETYLIDIYYAERKKTQAGFKLEIKVPGSGFGDLSAQVVPAPLSCSACGDGFLDLPTEQCDDGNQYGDDGCSAQCTIEACELVSSEDSEVTQCGVCGNGLVGENEQCDDGNLINGDGCNDQCSVEVPPSSECGNGIVEDGEQCDDNNQNNDDGCTNACVIDQDDIVCGNGSVEWGEECDDANTMNGDGCSVICTNEVITYAAYCGDGVVNQSWEACDDATESCTETCQLVDAPECSDLVFGRFVIDQFVNQGNGNMSDKLYIGTAAQATPENTWFLLYGNGAAVIDPAISGYNNVPGLAVQRANGTIAVAAYNGTSGDDREHIQGYFEISNGQIVSIAETSNQGMENQLDGVCNMIGNDELSLVDGDAVFCSTTTTGHDNFVITYQRNTTLCEYAPYCGDGVLNQDWEVCDGGEGCADTCQLIDQNACTDLILARVVVEAFANAGAGNMSDNVYVGSTANVVPSGTWFVVSDNGVSIVDPAINTYANVPGLAVQRTTSTLVVRSQNGTSSANREHVRGYIEWFNANPVSVANGTAPLENYNDGKYNATGNDEAWIAENQTVPFWMTTTSGHDSFVATYTENIECSITGSISGTKFYDHNRDAVRDEGDQGLSSWLITLQPGPVNSAFDYDDSGWLDMDDAQILANVNVELIECPAGKNCDYTNDSIVDIADVANFADYVSNLVIATTTTDENGAYAFADVAMGTYLVYETMQGGWQASTALVGTVILSTSTPTSTVDFGNYQTSDIACGDGILDAGEQCDDGNTVNGDGCSATCQNEGGQSGPVCGNEVVEEGEQCDDGNTTSEDGCSATCQNEEGGQGGPECGNGSVEQGEECDDSNTNNGDGCSSQCLEEGDPQPETPRRGGGGGGGVGGAVCGNGLNEAGEQCDDGNRVNGDGCSSFCALENIAACGNGTVDAGEQCDDGNTTNGDSCSATCQIEGTVLGESTGPGDEGNDEQPQGPQSNNPATGSGSTGSGSGQGTGGTNNTSTGQIGTVLGVSTGTDTTSTLMIFDGGTPTSTGINDAPTDTNSDTDQQGSDGQNGWSFPWWIIILIILGTIAAWWYFSQEEKQS